MARFTLKRGDTRPILEVTLVDPDGNARDLTGADSVTLHIELSDGTKLERSMSVHDAEAGVARYTWQASDWDSGNLVAGTHTMEYEVIDGAERSTYPNDGDDTLRIVKDIGDA